MRYLDRMLQDILSVTGTVFQAAEQFDDLRMQSLHSGIKRRLLALLSDFGFHFFLSFFHHFLDTSRMDTSVYNQFFESYPGDFTLDLGLDWSRDEGELMSYRLAIVLASKAAGIHAPIDAAWVQVGDAEGMRSSARRSVDHGFQGKLCIHPSQVEIVHDAYRPDAAAIARASAIVAAFEDAEAAGSAAIAGAGKLVDYPIYESARRLLLDARRSAAENLA